MNDMCKIARPLGAFALALLLLVGVPVAPARAQGVTTIPNIQGDGDRSPLVGETVTDVLGIVTDIVGNIGFYLQDPVGDDNDRTSDALFVYTDGTPQADGQRLAVGDGVAVTGPVAEFPNDSPNSLTEIVATTPEAIALLDTEQLLPPAVTVDLPGANTDFESLESMRVRIANPVVAGDAMGSAFALAEPAGLLVNPVGQEVAANPGDRFLSAIVGTLAYVRAADGYGVFVSGSLPEAVTVTLPEVPSTGPGQGNSDAPTETIFPDLTGQALRDRLVAQFREDTSIDDLNYAEARTILYGRIDNENGILRGVYTGLEVNVPFGSSDARKIAFQNGTGINAEHTWPQSKGARREPARSDMHHLFPTWANANSSRGSLPFADIDDERTNTWLGNDRTRLRSIPAANIDDFSEVLNNVAFEPPESHKGNVARAMFYFNTMYPDLADGNFFAQQRETLCRWHEQDPADAAEVARSNAIRGFQGNDNPFVLDPGLAARTYCN